jgi:hypothetical protein
MKSSRFLIVKVMQATVVSLAAGAVNGNAAEQSRLPEVLTFAVGYRIDSPTPRNIVEYGVVKACGNALCLTRQQFDSSKMLPLVPTKHHHHMQAPYGQGACTNGPVMTVEPDTMDSGTVKVYRNADVLVVEAKNFRYRWAPDSQVKAGYRLQEASLPTGGALAQGVGFAFSSDKQIEGDLKKADINVRYNGEIFHKSALTKASGEWEFSPSSIDYRKFDEAESGEVLVQSIPGMESVVKKYGKPMWVDRTVVLQRSAGTISPVIEEYGHDFNMDGCFNESGHNKMMLPVGESDGSVRAFVYIEYTSDNMRGFPMLSVGRYYR